MKSMYFLELNDGSLYTIENPPIQVDTSFQGQQVKGIEFTLTDTNLGQNQVTKIFGDAMAMAAIRVRCSDKSLACEYTNFTNLKRISIDDENNQYTVTMAESSDLPAIVSTLQKTIQTLEGAIAEHRTFMEESIQEQTEKLDQAVSDAETNLSDKFKTHKETMESELQSIHDGLNNFGDSVLQGVDNKISQVLNVEMEEKINSQKEAVREELRVLKEGLQDFGVRVLGNVDEKIDEQKKILETTNNKLIEDVQMQVQYALHPTINLEEMELDELKEYKISLSRENLSAYLKSHPITSSVHNGVEKQYSITAEKQQYLAQMIMLAEGYQRLSENALAASEESGNADELDMIPSFKISWNAVGEPCTYDWTLSELYQLSIEIESVVRPLISKQQKLEAQISEAVRRETVIAIDVSFDDSQNS